jgi:hypothetical protein
MITFQATVTESQSKGDFFKIIFLVTVKVTFKGDLTTDLTILVPTTFKGSKVPSSHLKVQRYPQAFSTVERYRWHN